MKRLRQLRKDANLTQDQLAQMLKTTQQTVARWETAKAEPNLSALRDLAVIFGTSVDDLLGRKPWSKKLTTNHLCAFDGESSDGFWGHLGVLLPGATFSKWFPITRKEASYVARLLANATTDSSWITVSTLNNRLLIIDVTKVRRLQLHDDNADPDSVDWEMDWDAEAGLPQEIYRALADPLGEYEADCSDAFCEIVEKLVAQSGMSSEELCQDLTATKVHGHDGTMQSFRIGDEEAYDVQFYMDLEPPALLNFSDLDVGMERYVATANISMIELPLHQVTDAAHKIHEEEGLDEEPATREVKAEPAVPIEAAKKKRGRPRNPKANLD